MNLDKAFKEEYERLNTEQKQAVDSVDGPVFVIAGPGTGKTQVLTLRIANILRTTDTPPDAILALTFTDSGAVEMRRRLQKIIGSRAQKVKIHTFHGFAESCIARYPDEFPHIIGAQVATDAERAEMMDSILLSAPVKHLRPFGDPLYYHYIAASAISTLKRENVTPDVLEERIREDNEAFEKIEGKIHEKGKYIGKMKGEFLTLKKKIEKTEDLLLVYRAYQDALTAARRYDYNDLILEVVQALETNESFRMQIQESLLYVLADEHQDANRAQNALLEMVSGFHERPNLFIVGDEKQAIYRFQGADLDNVQYFRAKFEGTTILTLVENYRSTQSILDTALSLISASPDERLSRVPLIANASVPAKPISITACATVEQEFSILASRIEKVLENGVPAGEIAVLVRRNRDVAEVARALTRAGIPVTGTGDEDALKNKYVLALLRLLRAVADPRDEKIAGILTLPKFPLTAADTARITQYARREKRSILSVMADVGALEAAKVSNVENAQNTGATLEKLARASSYERPGDVAEMALKESGLLYKAIGSPEREEALSSIRGLLRAFEDLSRREHDALLPRALELLDLYIDKGIRLPGYAAEEDGTRVRVMTVHRSKGREYTEVFMPILTSKAWSTRAKAEHFHLPDILSGTNELEDERRLLYVGITRAKHHATLSYSSTGLDDRALQPTPLLEDMAPELVENIAPENVPDWATLVTTELENGISTQELESPSEDDLATLRATYFAQGLSPTALNNYLRCPWKYFYVNLLRIPQVENKYMLFGTAIHSALNRYADERALDTEIGVEGLIRAFTYSLERSPLTEREIQEMHEKAEKSLNAWWAERHGAWPQATRAEVPVEASLLLGTHDGVEEVLTIRGKLDRIDENVSGVDVIDYKTGKTKSRNELMGSTKDSNGDYYRQLTFYKLLLARAEESRLMKEGIIEFVEPDDKGHIRTEAFTISDEEVIELEECIRKVSNEILTLSFWNEPCDEDECEWCGIRFSA